MEKLGGENEKLKRGNATVPQMSFTQAVQTRNTTIKSTIQRVANAPKTTVYITSKTGEDAKKVQETFTKTLDPTKIEYRCETSERQEKS